MRERNDFTGAYEVGWWNEMNQLDLPGVFCIGWGLTPSVSINFVGNEWFLCFTNPFSKGEGGVKAFSKFRKIDNFAQISRGFKVFL